MNRLTITFLFITTIFVGCQNENTNESSRIEAEINLLETIEERKMYLEKILQDDQKVRGSQGQEIMLKYGKDSKEDIDFARALWKQDSINLQKIEFYLNKFGYPKKNEIGKNATIAPWIVIHHSTDLNVRIRNFEFIYRAYLTKDIDPTAMSMYLNRTYEFRFNERFRIEGSYKTDSEINSLIEKLNLEEKKATVLQSLKN